MDLSLEFLQQRFIVVDESIRFLHFFWEFVVTSKHRVAPDYPFRHIHESSNSLPACNEDGYP